MLRWFQELNTYIGVTSLRCKLKWAYPNPSTKTPHWCSLKYVRTLIRISIGTLKHSKERARCTKVEGAITNRWSWALFYDCQLEQTEGYLKPVYSTWRRHFAFFLPLIFSAYGGYNTYLIISCLSKYRLWILQFFIWSIH